MEKSEASGFEKLGTDNYSIWAVQMRATLMKKKVWDQVEGRNVEPEKDQEAWAHIILNVQKHHLAALKTLPTSKRVWDSLKALFQSQNTGRKLKFYNDLLDLKMQPGESVAHFFARAEGLKADLESVGGRIEEDMLCLSLVRGLPSSFDTVKTILRTSTTSLTLKEVQAKLMLEEPATAGFQDSSTDTTTALVAQQQKRGGNFKRQQYNCDYCGRKGHTAPYCRDKQRDEQRGNGGGRSREGSLVATIAL